MDRSSTRAWRRIQKKRVWNKRLRIIFKTCSPAYLEDISTGSSREAETWEELRQVKWCQVYRTTAKPCSCFICTHERYDRQAFIHDTRSAIKEQLDID